jgi:hypothetical protein
MLRITDKGKNFVSVCCHVLCYANCFLGSGRVLRWPGHCFVQVSQLPALQAQRCEPMPRKPPQVGPHSVPQPPQWVRSAFVFTQLPPQHVSPLPQTLPQPPQLFSSLVVSTHSSSQLSGVFWGQHLPSAHTWAFSQLVAQSPQCAVSLPVSTQVPSHTLLASSLHTQPCALALQVASLGQVLLHA